MSDEQPQPQPYRLAFLQDSVRQHTNGRGVVPILELFHDEVHMLAREYMADRPGTLRIVVVSGKYGLIDASIVVAPYSARFTYEYVDKWYKVLKKQWDAKHGGWFDGISDVFLGLNGPYLYALQRLEVAIGPAAQVKRMVYGNIAVGAQFARWLREDELGR